MCDGRPRKLRFDGQDILKSAFPQPVMLAFFCVIGIGMLQSALELVSGQAMSSMDTLPAAATLGSCRLQIR